MPTTVKGRQRKFAGPTKQQVIQVNDAAPLTAPGRNMALGRAAQRFLRSRLMADQLAAGQSPIRIVRQDLTVATEPAMIYSTGLFDICSDEDLLSLSFMAAEPFLDWIGWESSNVFKIQRNFIHWVRPARSGEEASVGWQANPCVDGNGAEWGATDFELQDFARIRRISPVRDVTEVGMIYCEAQPRYRLDGTLIANDIEFDLAIAGEVLLQDLRRMTVTGNANTDGQFSGLEVLIKNGYLDTKGRPAGMMDSIIIDWNENDGDQAGSGDVTWNGVTIPGTANIIDVLRAVHARIGKRISWSPQLAAQRLRMGDQIIMGPSPVLECLMDADTCWNICGGDAMMMDSYEARDYRNKLQGGLFGNGRIYLNGVEIPLLAFDWELEKGENLYDFYFLTGSVGNIDILQGQYLDMNTVSERHPRFGVMDGGRILNWPVEDNTCERQSIEMRPRLLAWAPWAQARFMDFECTRIGGYISPDPESENFPEHYLKVFA